MTYGLDSNNVYSVMVEYGEPWLVAHFYTVGEWHMIAYRYQGGAYGRSTLRVNGDYATDKCTASGCPYWPLRNTSYAGVMPS